MSLVEGWRDGGVDEGREKGTLLKVERYIGQIKMKRCGGVDKPAAVLPEKMAPC